MPVPNVSSATIWLAVSQTHFPVVAWPVCAQAPGVVCDSKQAPGKHTLLIFFLIFCWKGCVCKCASWSCTWKVCVCVCVCLEILIEICWFWNCTWCVCVSTNCAWNVCVSTNCPQMCAMLKLTSKVCVSKVTALEIWNSQQINLKYVGPCRNWLKI